MNENKKKAKISKIIEFDDDYIVLGVEDVENWFES